MVSFFCPTWQVYERKASRGRPSASKRQDGGGQKQFGFFWIWTTPQCPHDCKVLLINETMSELEKEHPNWSRACRLACHDHHISIPDPRMRF